MNNFNKLKDLLASMEVNADKFYNKGVSAAGTRVRKGLQDIKTLASDMRKEVTLTGERCNSFLYY
jgi:hypothetical protein